eukprot:270092-Rhodomonas_salina.4
MSEPITTGSLKRKTMDSVEGGSQLKRERECLVTKSKLVRDVFMVKVLTEGISAIKSIFTDTYRKDQVFRNIQQKKIQVLISHVRQGTLQYLASDDFRSDFEVCRGVLLQKRRSLNPALLKLLHMQPMISVINGLNDSKLDVPALQKAVTRILQDITEFLQRSTADTASKCGVIDCRDLYSVLMSSNDDSTTRDLEVFGFMFIAGCKIVGVKL